MSSLLSTSVPSHSPGPVYLVGFEEQSKHNYSHESHFCCHYVVLGMGKFVALFVVVPVCRVVLVVPVVRVVSVVLVVLVLSVVLVVLVLSVFLDALVLIVHVVLVFLVSLVLVVPVLVFVDAHFPVAAPV